MKYLLKSQDPIEVHHKENFVVIYQKWQDIRLWIK